jgi:hypothetical protein
MRQTHLWSLLAFLAFFSSCNTHEPVADRNEVRRLVIAQDTPGTDTSTVEVQLVHPEVAVAFAQRAIIQPQGDTLRLTQVWVYVYDKRGWACKVSS